MFDHFSGMRGVYSYSCLINCWILMKFSSLNSVRKFWILVSNMGYMNWVVGDARGLRIAN